MTSAPKDAATFASKLQRVAKEVAAAAVASDTRWWMYGIVGDAALYALCQREASLRHLTVAWTPRNVVVLVLGEVAGVDALVTSFAAAAGAEITFDDSAGDASFVARAHWLGDVSVVFVHSAEFNCMERATSAVAMSIAPYRVVARERNGDVHITCTNSTWFFPKLDVVVQGDMTPVAELLQKRGFPVRAELSPRAALFGKTRLESTLEKLALEELGRAPAEADDGMASKEGGAFATWAKGALESASQELTSQAAFVETFESKLKTLSEIVADLSGNVARLRVDDPSKSAKEELLKDLEVELAEYERILPAYQSRQQKLEARKGLLESVV